jgi:alanine racemase
MIFTNSWVEISRSALNKNIKTFKQIAGSKVKLMTVIKSNAYGHGLVEVGQICDRNKAVDFLGVAGLEEALILRNSKIVKPILILSYYSLDQKLKQAIKQNISLVVYDLKQVKYLDRLAKKENLKVKVHLKVDTGTSRLGVSSAQALEFIIKICRFKNIYLEGLFTHYASAEKPNESFTRQQTQKFYQLIEVLEKGGILIPFKHAACSAASFDPDCKFDMIRPGISLYGLWSLEDGYYLKSKYQLKPVLSWKTKIIQIKEVKSGITIGYGQTYKVKEPSKIAVLPVGYWEGFDRHLSNRGEVLIHGRRCPVRGRICMNLIMVDVTKIKKVKVNDEVVLIGRQLSAYISADELSQKIGTINYEVVTRINPLLLRIVI